MSRRLLALPAGLLALLVCAAPSKAQSPPVTPQFLNEHCTVSVLNRNVRANADGTWILPNVPANFGPVRARATCVIEGRTVSGESAPFDVPANGAVNIPEIILGDTTPIPTALTITAPTTTLTSVGASVQLAVSARYSDGSVSDVTAAAVGTSYTISNAAIATISPGALVQAVTSGTVLIQATLEGASGMFAVRVALAGTDTDGDGIPDDVELQLGMNPNNAVDALEDFDRDGLSNVDEYQRGTGLRNTDSDGDGLSDGDEVNVHTTNPFLPDTDGDRIPDGIEVQTQTNPLNPASYDLRAATGTSILRPQSFRLSTSPLALSASQLLSWSVNLIDGKTTLDLTDDLRTSYSSSDLTICNFGSQKGLVFAGNPGNCVITISQNTLSVTVPGTIQSFTPTERSSIGISGAVAVDAAGTFAYVAAGANGLVVVDVTDAATPRLRGSLAGLGNAVAIRAFGQRALVGDANGVLRIVDASNPDAPTVLASLPIAGRPNAIAVQGSIAAVAAQAGGVSFVDLSDLTAPSVISTVAVPGTALGIDFDTPRGIAAVAMGSAGLQLVDISALNAPQLRGLLPGGDVRRVLLKYPAALLADVQRSVTAVNITNPNQPTIASSIPPNLGGSPVDVAAFGTVAMTADVSFGRAIPVITLANPLQPSTVLFWTPGSAGFSSSIAVDARFGYLVMTNQLRIFQYQDVVDTAGIPPTVQITSPLNGMQAIHGSTVTVRATATDDVAVAQVNFFVNGQPALAVTAAPYEYKLTIPGSGSTLTLGATAADFGNNTGTAAEIVLNLIPDPLTTVTGRVVLQDGTPVVGASVQCASRAGSSLADGSFTIADIPTIQQTIVCTAGFVTDTGVLLGGRSNAVQPVRSGTTDVGAIALAPVPVITSITPKVIDAGAPPATIHVTGANLIGATFSFATSAVAVGAPHVNTDGTAATLPITVVATARGRFALIGTNASGSSNATPTPGNTLTLVNAQDEVDSDGDGFLDGLELLFGSDPADASSVPALNTRGDVRSTAVAVLNTALPGTTANETVSAAFSVSNTQLPTATTQTLVSSAFSVANTFAPATGSQSLVGQAFSVLNSANQPTSQQVIGPAISILNTLPGTPVSQQMTQAPSLSDPNAQASTTLPLRVSISGLVAGQTVVEGQTLIVGAVVSGAAENASVTFSVNGIPLVTDTSAPYALIFTVPAGLQSLTFGAATRDETARTASAQSIEVVVERDVATSVSGRVVDSAGNPVAGAVVELISEGLRAEFFEYTAPLSALPNLADQRPTRTTRVTAVNMRGPNELFGFDPFGVGLAPDYAARFTGWIAIPTSGVYTFHLGADEGARLRIGGLMVVDMPTPAVGGYQEQSATIALEPGSFPMEITFYESVGNAQLQLAFTPPGGERQVLPPSMLVPGAAPFSVVTGADGRFTLDGVPTALRVVQARATVTTNGQTVTATSLQMSPVSANGVQVGDIVMTPPR